MCVTWYVLMWESIFLFGFASLSHDDWLLIHTLTGKSVHLDLVLVRGHTLTKKPLTFVSCLKLGLL